MELAFNIYDGLLISVNGISESQSVYASVVIALLCFVLAIYIALYVLRSIGLYKLAVGAGVKCAWLAWIPFLWVYLGCLIVAEKKFFDWTFGKVSLIILILICVSAAISIVYTLISYIPIFGYVLQGGTIYYAEETGVMQLMVGKDYINPFDGLTALNIVLRVFNIINAVLNIVVVVIKIFMFIAIFRKFWPEHYILASLFSVFLEGLMFPIFIFVIRNKKAVDFKEYIRARYYGRNVYGQNPSENTDRPPEHPFSEFAEHGDVDPGDPFSEFSDKNDKNDKDE